MCTGHLGNWWYKYLETETTENCHKDSDNEAILKVLKPTFQWFQVVDIARPNTRPINYN
jgi:hypothetical protein